MPGVPAANAARFPARSGDTLLLLSVVDPPPMLVLLLLRLGTARGALAVTFT